MTSNGDDTGSFSKMPQTELKELVERFKNLLRNPKVLEKLEDKGERVRKKICAAENEIKRRESVVTATFHLDQMSIGEPSVVEAAVQLDQMSIRDPSYDQKQSNCRSDEKAIPKLCTKLEECERHRKAKNKFKPFRTLERPPEINPDRDQTSESVPRSRQGPPMKEISTLSLNDSLKVAALSQTLIANLYREDSALFGENPGKKISFIPAVPELLDFHSDVDDRPKQDPDSNVLEELD